MAITDLPLVSMLKDRLHWHQARQKVLADNVANANTPGFKPSELRQPSAAEGAAGAGFAIERTSPLHLASASSSSAAGTGKADRYETSPAGNAVNLEDEMLKISTNQADYQLAASLYQKSLSMLRMAAGVRGSA